MGESAWRRYGKLDGTKAEGTVKTPGSSIRGVRAEAEVESLVRASGGTVGRGQCKSA